MSERYSKSEKLLASALEVNPLGTQTFSKSKTALPYGVSPYFLSRAEGSRFWDVDGNEYIDFVNGLCCVTLGYQDPDVDRAVSSQMKNGVTFSLPHQLEIEVSERLIEHIPCAELVRFAKNGSDATSGAIRVARAITGRERVAVCGYHGWQDWYIGSTKRDLGVPDAVKELTHQFTYNDVESLRQLLIRYSQGFAAIIMEPMNSDFPEDGFLESVRALASRHGALLIFDETITGFRYDIGGAQKLFGVTPDLATFGKGIANGYPLSALVGRKQFMNIVEDIFFSGTFGGETLSLAAANAVIKKLESESVIESISMRGNQVMKGVTDILARHRLSDVIGISGHPSWSFLRFRDTSSYSLWQIKTFFLQEVFIRGIYTLGSHNMSYAHSEKDIASLLDCYDQVFSSLALRLANHDLVEHLRCEPVKPLFRVR